MLRIKDPKKSIPFYESLGFSVLTEKHFPQVRRGAERSSK